MNFARLSLPAVCLLLAAACAKGTVRPPVSNAGAAQSVNASSLVHLDGTSSLDPQGKTLTYTWALDVVPAGSAARLDDVHSPRPSFTADLPGRYVASLLVSNGTSSATSTVEINVSTCGAGVPAVASVSASSTHAIATTAIKLSAVGVHDPDNDPGCALNKTLTYVWSLERPAGSNAALDGLNSVSPGFTPDLEGNYAAVLVVKDADGRASQPARTAILVANPSATLSTATVTGNQLTADGASSAALHLKIVDSTGYALAGLPVQISAPSCTLTDATPRTPAVAASGKETLTASTNATGDLAINVTTTLSGAKVFTLQVNGGAAPRGFVFPVSPQATFAAGAPTHLAFSAQPADTTPGATLAPLTVTAYDAFANIATSTPLDVTLALSTNNGRPAAGKLSGTLTVNTGTTGTATFADLAIDNPAGPPDTATGGYALTASSSSAAVAPLATSTFNSIPPLPLAAPNLRGQGADTGHVTLAWDTPATTAWIASYQVIDSSGAVLATVPAGVNTATVSAAPAALASYTLVTTDVLGQVSANTPAVALKPLPAAPANLTASADSKTNTVTVNWTPVVDCCIASYVVAVNGTVAATVTGSSAVLKSLAPATYTVSVTAVDSQAQSSLASTVSATIKPPAIQSFVAGQTTITSGKATSLTGTFTDGFGQIDPGAIVVTSGQTVSTGPLTATTTYTLTVKDQAGNATSSPVTVTVVPAPVVSSFGASPWPVIATGTSTSLVPVFANGTGAIDQNIGAVTSAQGVATASLTTPTSYTLTVTNPAGDSVQARTTVYPTSVQPIFGAPGSPGSSCRQILDAGLSYGDGLYNLDPDQTGTPFKAWCDMTLDGGGFTVFYAGLNGKANAFNNFSTAAVDCADPHNHCMRRLPGALGRTADIAATCGSHAFKTVVDGWGFAYLQKGIGRGWTSISAPVSLAAGTNLTNINSLYTSSIGFILSAPAQNASTFLSTYTSDFSWDYCNGSPDTVSTIRLLSRETTATSFSLILPSQPVANVATAFIVTAADAGGRPVKGYRGTVHIKSSDGTTIPDATFTAADGGSRRITGVTFATTGSKTITVMDAYKSSLTGSATALAGSTAIGGTTAGSVPALSCLDVLLSGSSKGTGQYQLQPAGVSAPFVAFCDMDFNGGGWTLTLSTRNGQGPGAAAFGVVDPSSGLTQAMPLATFTAMSKAAREVHLRTAGQVATQSITSYPETQPIRNMRAQLSLAAILNQMSDSDYYGPFATPDHLDASCPNTQGPFPNLYQACGTNGAHLLNSASRWNWNNGNDATNVPMEYYLR